MPRSCWILASTGLWSQQSATNPCEVLCDCLRNLGVGHRPGQVVTISLPYFGQFEARHSNYALQWDRDEALRLAAWTCWRSGAMSEGNDIKSAGADELSQLMLPVWGDKMGSAKSREARSEQWFIAALSDFGGQIQARDVVLFLAEAAKHSVQDTKWSDRILIPGAMRNALRTCSEQKIKDIESENIPVGELLRRLRDQPSDNQKVPFTLVSVGLDAEQASLLEANGVLFREEDQYWIPEIFRHGLGFKTLRRPRVLAIANLVRRRND